MRPGWYWPPYTGRTQKAHRVSRTHSHLVVSGCGHVFDADAIREVASPAVDEKCRICLRLDETA